MTSHSRHPMRRSRATTCAPLLLLAALTVLATGCVTAMESDVHPATTPNEDHAYTKALTAATRQRTVYKDFETRYTVAATHLGPNFRSAFAARLARVYKMERTQFDEARTKVGFFVSLHMPGDGATDLENPQHWTVTLTSVGTSIRPTLVKKLTDKERWRAFFPAVNPWSVEYLLLFDAPAATAKSADLMAQPGLALSFANADGQVELVW